MLVCYVVPFDSAGGVSCRFSSGMDLLHLFLQHRLRIRNFCAGCGCCADFRQFSHSPDCIDVRCALHFRMQARTLPSDTREAVG